ncbi:hypothetical protein [Chitinophaga pinensis]|uniref:Uncharacterized protein n=1 Tax=Chitinophaga pinensis (strain ATCC 43595 / DSM 2588 / LMG 13176 / NBRC 15968 / NCIMB 11800 / UQM 2034) TaxID=485918 RepID=A0A979G9S2_CHIPD|nr:hypothetical protein [Chitinophaga pinensis]ACU63272.1 hypothetical protein Cpin_5853 [Chitinophaga pinensis DSM 2588]
MKSLIMLMIAGLSLPGGKVYAQHVIVRVGSPPVLLTPRPAVIVAPRPVIVRPAPVVIVRPRRVVCRRPVLLVR